MCAARARASAGARACVCVCVRARARACVCVCVCACVCACVSCVSCVSCVFRVCSVCVPCVFHVCFVCASCVFLLCFMCVSCVRLLLFLCVHMIAIEFIYVLTLGYMKHCVNAEISVENCVFSTASRRVCVLAACFVKHWQHDKQGYRFTVTRQSAKYFILFQTDLENLAQICSSYGVDTLPVPTSLQDSLGTRYTTGLFNL